MEGGREAVKTGQNSDDEEMEVPGAGVVATVAGTPERQAADRAE